MSEVNAGATNPNIPVTNTMTSNDGSNRVEIESGGGPLTFDELEQVIGEKKRAKSPESKPKAEKSQDLTSDADKGKPKSEAPKPKPESKPKDPEKSEKPEAEEKPARKTVKAKYADSELDLDEESTIPVTINGKEEFVQLKDLRSNFSGKTAWDQKFTELSKHRKEVGQRELKLQETAARVKSIFEEQDPEMKIYKMSQLAGIDPVQFRQNFLDQNISLLEKWNAMNDDERRADALSYENKIYKHRADTLESSIAQEQTHRELTAKIDSLRARHQVSEEEFAARTEQMAAHERMMAAKYSDYKPNEITPEFAIETIEKDRLWNAAEARIKELGLEWNEETKRKNLIDLVERSHKLGFPPSEMADNVDIIWGTKKTQKIVEAKKNQKDEFMHGKKDVPKTMNSSSGDPSFFDDI